MCSIRYIPLLHVCILQSPLPVRHLLMSWRYSCHVVGSDRQRVVLSGTWRQTGFLKACSHQKALKPPHACMCSEYHIPVHAQIKLKPSSQSMFCQWLLMNLKTGSKLNIFPTLYKHHYDSNNPKVLALFHSLWNWHSRDCTTIIRCHHVI